MLFIMAALRLAIEPIPASSRLASLANLLPPDQWDRLRRAIYQRARYRCQICGREGRLHCHEVWQFNANTGHQWLAGFQALCDLCHGAKHLHFAREAASHAELLRHFAGVNHLTTEEVRAHVTAARERQLWLDQRAWTVHYANYNVLMPCLTNVSQRRRFARQLRP